MELKEVTHAGDGKGHGRRCHTRHQQWQQAAQREVNHQHLQREHQSCDGCLENARHGTCRPAAHEEHHLLGVEAEQLSQVAAYG